MVSKKLCAAAVVAAAVVVVTALLSFASAGGAQAGSSTHKAFCFAGSPTPKHVCNTLKAAEVAKPQTVQPTRKLVAR